MSVKRNLPGWMVAFDNKSKGKDEQIRKTFERKPEVNATKRVRRKCIKRMVYWMNERELVETARGVLKRDNAEAAASDSGASPNTETTLIPETDPEDTDDSGTAVEIAERETVPYGEALEKRRCSPASESSDVRCLTTSAGLENNAKSDEDRSDHEALQVLRNIFFT